MAALVACGRERARLAAIEAEVLARFDAQAGYVVDGALDTRSWLTRNTGVARAEAGSRVRLARRLARMPATFGALSAGTITEAHARLLARCVTARTEAAFARDEAVLVAAAVELDADDLAVVVARWLLLHDADGPDPGRERPSHLHTSRTFGGRIRIDGDLDLEDAAEVLAELDALRDELWHQDQAADDDDPCKGRTHSERSAAALVEMARRSSAVGDRDDDPDDDGAGSAASTVSGSSGGGSRRARGVQLHAVIDVDALAGRYGGDCHLEDGTPIPEEIYRRWLCDCAIARIVVQGRSLPIDLGTTTYTPSAAQRRAVHALYGGRCFVPGCDRKARWCQVHHVVPYPHGPTAVSNLIPACTRHHRRLHGGSLLAAWDDDRQRWTATRPDGTPLRPRRHDTS